MNKTSFRQLEERLYENADAFIYPPTPNIAASVNWARYRSAGTRQNILLGSRFGWAIILLLITLIGLMAVPPVRAQVVKILQIGGIRILLETTTPTSLPTVTPAHTPSQLPAVLNLSGRTTLAQARNQLDFPVRLPAYPESLGPPDYVFLENFGGPIVILVWMQPDHPDDIRLSLMQLGPGAFIEKTSPEPIVETTVNNHPAIWTEGPHHLRFISASQAIELKIEGNVLIWEDEEITYRLEGDFSLQEFIKIAESLE